MRSRRACRAIGRNRRHGTSMTFATLHRERWSVFIWIILAQLLLALGSHSWGPLAPFLKESMRLSNAEVGYIGSIFYLASACSAFPAGLIVDLLGVKKGLLLWLGITGLPLMLMKYTSAHFLLFLLLLAVSGIGYGMGNPVAAKGLYIAFKRGVRGTVFGLRQCTVTLGGALAGIWMVALSQKSGPFVSLQVVSCGIVVTGFLCLIFFPAHGREEAQGEGRAGKRAFSGQGLKGLLTSKALLIMTLIGMALGFSQGVVGAFLVLYLSSEVHLSVIAAGGLFSLMMVGATCARLLWGMISDRAFGGRRKPVLLLVSSLASVSLLILGLWDAHWPPWLMTPLVLAIGASTWGWNSIFFVMVTETSDSDHTATFLGFTTAFGWLGIASGPLIFGNVSEAFGYAPGWMTVVACCAVAGVLSFSVPESEAPPGKGP